MKYEKISPGLLSILQGYQDGGAGALLDQSRVFGIMEAENNLSSPRTVVFIRSNENATYDHLLSHGIIVNQNEGALRTAILPIDGLDELTEQDSVHRVVPATYLRPSMDIASQVVSAPYLRSNLSINGNGVVIGIVDSGIDATHPGFAGRIDRIWDQTMVGAGVPEGAYGAELTGALINRSKDTLGHGTHVAGIAAGDDSQYCGIAPSAKLIVVKTDFLNAHIADAVRYIFRVASELGMPAVVNLSLGGHSDAHDGTDPLSLIIDAETGPGRIVCCAAGNEGEDDIHARAWVNKSGVASVHFRIPSFIVPGSKQTVTPIALINGWYSGDDDIQIAVESPRGLLTPFQPVIVGGNASRQYDLPGAKVIITTPSKNPDNDDYQFLIEIRHPNGTAGPSAHGIWVLHLLEIRAPVGRVDVWALDDSGGAVTFRGPYVSDDMKIGSPGSATSAITVGAYTCRNEWVDINGERRNVSLEHNHISNFSSAGPLRTGGRKPDVVAPGAMIASALSSTSNADLAYHVKNLYRINAGTSMACPVIAGAVALLLEYNKQLDPGAVRSILCACAAKPGQAPGTGLYDPKWGWGLVDLMALANRSVAIA